MTKHQYTQMLLAARELIRLHSTGAEVDPHTLEWAAAVSKMNPPPPAPFKPSPNHQLIFAALEAAPFDGLTAGQIALKIDKSKALTSATLSYMAKQGLIASVKLSSNLCIFFRDEARKAVGEPHVRSAAEQRKGPGAKRQVISQEERAARRVELKARVDAAKLLRKAAKAAEKDAAYKRAVAERDAAKQIKRAAWDARNKPQPKPHQTMQIKAKATSPGVTIAPPPKASIKHSVFIPEHVQVQQLPSGRDTRFDPDPNSEGAGFMAEWRAKRGITT